MFYVILGSCDGVDRWMWFLTSGDMGGERRCSRWKKIIWGQNRCQIWSKGVCRRKNWDLGFSHRVRNFIPLNSREPLKSFTLSDIV